MLLNLKHSGVLLIQPHLVWYDQLVVAYMSHI